LFLNNASQMSYKKLLLRQALEGETVSRFMRKNPVTVEPSVSVADLVENYIYNYHYKMFPVMEGDKIRGCVSTKEVKEVPRNEWENKTVEDLVDNCSDSNTIRPDTDAVRALSMMSKTGNSRLLVVDNNELVGIITLKDLTKFLSLKLDLESDEIQKLQK